MALNLRTIDKPLHEGLKIWALSSGKGVDEFCVEILRKALLVWTGLGGDSVVVTVEAVEKDVDHQKVWTAAGKCQHGYVNSYACERSAGGCRR